MKKIEPPQTTYDNARRLLAAAKLRFGTEPRVWLTYDVLEYCIRKHLESLPVTLAKTPDLFAARFLVFNYVFHEMDENGEIYRKNKASRREYNIKPMRVLMEPPVSTVEESSA